MSLSSHAVSEVWTVLPVMGSSFSNNLVSGQIHTSNDLSQYCWGFNWIRGRRKLTWFFHGAAEDVTRISQFIVPTVISVRYLLLSHRSWGPHVCAYRCSLSKRVRNRRKAWEFYWPFARFRSTIFLVIPVLVSKWCLKNRFYRDNDLEQSSCMACVDWRTLTKMGWEHLKRVHNFTKIHPWKRGDLCQNLYRPRKPSVRMGGADRTDSWSQEIMGHLFTGIRFWL